MKNFEIGEANRANKPETANYKFFSHTACEYFPCHRTNKPEEFNCLFCYCPLYFFGEDCGGGFVITNSGVKDCSACMLPHSRSGWEHINNKLGEYFNSLK